MRIVGKSLYKSRQMSSDASYSLKVVVSSQFEIFVDYLVKMHVILTVLLAIPWITGERINPADVTYVEGTAPPEIVAGPASRQAKVYFASTIRPDSSSSSKFDRFVGRQYTYTPRPAGYSSTESSVGSSSNGYDYSRGGVTFAPSEGEVVSTTYNPVTVTVGPTRAVPVNLGNGDSSYVSPAYGVSSTTYPTISSTSGFQRDATMSREYSRIAHQPQVGRSRNYTVSFGNPVKAKPVSLRYTSTTPEPFKSRSSASPKSAAFIDGHAFVESQDVALIPSTLVPHIEYTPTVVTPISADSEHISIHPIAADHGHVPIYPIGIDHELIPATGGAFQPVFKTRKIEVRRPAIRKQFYDIEERIIIRPAGSVLLELDHPLVSAEKDHGSAGRGSSGAGGYSGSDPQTKGQPSYVPPNQIPQQPPATNNQVPYQPTTYSAPNPAPNQDESQQPSTNPQPNPPTHYQPPTQPPPNSQQPDQPPSLPAPTQPAQTYPAPNSQTPNQQGSQQPSTNPQRNPQANYQPPAQPPPNSQQPDQPPSLPVPNQPAQTYPAPNSQAPNQQESQQPSTNPQPNPQAHYQPPTQPPPNFQQLHQPPSLPAPIHPDQTYPAPNSQAPNQQASINPQANYQSPTQPRPNPQQPYQTPTHPTSTYPAPNSQPYQPMNPAPPQPAAMNPTANYQPRQNVGPDQGYGGTVDPSKDRDIYDEYYGNSGPNGPNRQGGSSSQPNYQGQQDQAQGQNNIQQNPSKPLPGYEMQGQQGPSYPQEAPTANNYQPSHDTQNEHSQNHQPAKHPEESRPRSFLQTSPGVSKPVPRDGSPVDNINPSTGNMGNQGYDQSYPKPQYPSMPSYAGMADQHDQGSNYQNSNNYYQSPPNYQGYPSSTPAYQPSTSYQGRSYPSTSTISYQPTVYNGNPGSYQSTQIPQNSYYGGQQQSQQGQGSGYSQPGYQNSGQKSHSGMSQQGQGPGYPQSGYQSLGQQSHPGMSQHGQGFGYPQSAYQSSGHPGTMYRTNYNNNNAGQYYPGNQGSYQNNQNQYYPSGHPSNYPSQPSGHDSSKQPVWPSFGTTEHYGDYNDVKLHHTNGPSMANDNPPSSQPTGHPETGGGSSSAHPSTTAQPPVYEKYHPQARKSDNLREEPCTHNNRHMQQSRPTSSIAPSAIRAFSHPEDDDDSVVIEARVSELDSTSTERSSPRFSQRNHYGYRRPSQDQRDYLHQAELQSKQEQYRGRQRYETTTSGEFSRLSEAPETNFDRNNDQSSTPRVRYQEYFQAKQYPAYSRSSVTSMRPVHENYEYSTQSNIRPTAASTVPQNNQYFRQSTSEPDRPIYSAQNPRFATASGAPSQRQYYQPRQQARANYSTPNNTYQAHDTNMPSNSSASITISNQNFNLPRRRLPSPIHFSPHNSSFRTDTPMPRMVSIGQPDFRYPPYVETRSRGAPLQTHSNYEVNEHANSENDEASFPSVSPRPRLTPEQSSANQKQYIELLFAQGKVAEVGLGPGESNGGLELSENGYLRGRVIAATPAPPHAEASETVHTRRIVVSHPFETVQEVEINEPITKLERFAISEPGMYHTGADHHVGHGHYEEPSYRIGSHYSAVH